MSDQEVQTWFMVQKIGITVLTYVVFAPTKIEAAAKCGFSFEDVDIDLLSWGKMSDLLGVCTPVGCDRSDIARGDLLFFHKDRGFVLCV